MEDDFLLISILVQFQQFLHKESKNISALATPLLQMRKEHQFLNLIIEES